MIKIASQFSGIGAFEQAITNLGIEHENIMAVDFDKYARQTYTANFGEPKHYFVDSYNADYENVENVDVFLSSPPCQSFSLAGKRLGESDPRGLLFFETLRFVNCNKPKYFIIENVKGLLSMDDGEVFRNWIQLLGQSENGNTFMFPHEDSLMYNLHWQVLNTKDYGLPQNRERVFLIGIRNDLPNDFNFPKTIPLKLRLKDILEDIVDEKYYLSDKTISYITKREGVYTDFNPEISRTICDQYAQSSNGSFIKSDNIIQVGNVNPSGIGMNGNVFSENGISPTLTTNKGEGVKVMIGAMRGRNLENPSDRTPGAPTQQMLEINENGTSNCLTSVQKDNLVVEGIIQLNNPKHSNDRIYSDEGLSPTLNTMQGGNRQPFIQVIGSTGGKNDHNSRIYGTDGISPTILAGNNGGGQSPVKHLTHDYRIRKLSPLECFRLQGFPDEFLQNAIDAGVSNSQLYKQAGNSISVPVIQAILNNLLK